MNNVDVTDNYRDICLSSIFSTLFTRILNARLQKEEQAGFRRGYSTIDNAFILKSFVQKYLDNGVKCMWLSLITEKFSILLTEVFYGKSYVKMV